MWSSWAENAKSSMTQALEKTGDVLSKAATNAGKSARKKAQQETETAADSSSIGGYYAQPTIVAIPTPDKGQDLLHSISQGWSQMMENTRASMKQAEEIVKEQQLMLQQKLSKARSAFYKRDPSLPLDVEALKDAGVVYITDRIITMGHPASSEINPEITAERKLAAVGHLLTRRHAGRYMVWNLSELEYDVDILDDQVLTYSFPGSPSPPLGLLLKLLISMESWLKADERNVAVVHCLTGKGRTSTVLAAFLCWMGEAGFSDIYDALEYIAACKQTSSDDLTIPSQRRYASYFKNMLDGIRPAQPPLMLRRIIMSEAPRYAKGPPRHSSNDNKYTEDQEVQLLGCVPYIQIFKAGRLLQTAPASLHFQQAENELPFCQVADGSISFHINLVVQGDILIRARHLTANRKRVSMFRAAFHTGYAPPNVMRLTKAQLDGAVTDDRFVPDFFIDLIFEPVDAEAASKLLQEENAERKPEPHPASTNNENEDSSSHVKTILATTDDSMLHRDSRFWEVIACRMRQHATDNNKQEGSTWGPTVGRRRLFTAKDTPSEDSTPEYARADRERTTLETFSIGGELDFLPETIDRGSSIPHSSQSSWQKNDTKKDPLLDALMGALDEDDGNEGEIIFEEIIEEEEMCLAASGADQKDFQQPTEEPSDGAGSTQSTMAEKLVVSNMTSTGDEISDLLADANLNIEEDMNALLAGGGGEENMIDLDIDDADLDDLENFLSK